MPLSAYILGTIQTLESRNSELDREMKPKAPDDARLIPASVDDLPSPDTIRWHTHRKARVVAGVRIGLISLEDACRRYRLSAEEFASWRRLIDEHGLLGLRVTYCKQYRRTSYGAGDSVGAEPLLDAIESTGV